LFQQNPSVRTKWLSGDDFASGDSTGDATNVVLESSGSKKDGFESRPCKITFDGKNDEHLLWEPATDVLASSREEAAMSDRSWNPGGATAPRLDVEEETIRNKSNVEESKEYCFVDQLVDSSTLVSQQQFLLWKIEFSIALTVGVVYAFQSYGIQDWLNCHLRVKQFDSCVEEGKEIGDVGPKNAALESPKNLGGNRAQSDSPRVMSPGKAMLHKILSECSSPAAPSSRATSKPEKCDVPLGTVESGSDDLAREQSNPFSTRGMILSSSLESDPDFSNTSTDDDIAGCHSLDPKIAEVKANTTTDEGGKMKSKATLGTEASSFRSPMQHAS
ncbi:hypothetical protein ANCCAN_16532, partial [Ancylostoma caninum]